uniref:Uncharacterized protein n=1 Tax=Panagrellus redivivus TaxID=6233 RepID=A0A7E4ZSE0_PANRE
MSKQSLIHSFFTKTPDSDTADSFCTHSGSTSLATSHASGTLPMHHNDTLEVQLGEKGECDGPSLPNTTSLEIDTTEFDKNKDTETANKDNETAKCDSPVQKGILPFDPGNFLDNRSKVTTQEKIAILQCIPLKGVAKNKL